jgi:c-di-GMP-binding flagellar brake protein YcgR
MIKPQQRRMHERSAARLPVWIRDANTGTFLQGHTANISEGGMYLLTSVGSELPLGAAVRVVFGLFDENGESYRLHQAEQGAEVVRLEKLGYGTGMALKFTPARVCRCPLEQAFLL